MEPLRFAERAVVEPFASLDAAELAGRPLFLRSLSLSPSLLYLGSAAGDLLLLSLSPSPSPSPRLLRSSPISTRPIESILSLPEIHRILVLSDASLFLLDPLLAQPARRLAFVKDATAVSRRLPGGSDPFVDAASRSETLSPGQRLLHKLSSGIRANGTRPRASEPSRDGEGNCYVSVASGKKLLLIELFLFDSDPSYGGVSVNLKEILGVDGVKAVAWIGDSVIVGTMSGYTLISIGSGRSTPLFSLPESSGPPRLRPLWRSSEVLLLVDNVGVIVNALGQPVGGSLIFQDVPESIAEMGPFVVATRDGRVDLYGRKTGVCVQSVSFAKSGSGLSVVVSDEQGSGEIIVAATPYQAVCFRKVPSEEQIKYLLRKKSFREVICLVEELDSEGEMTKELLSFVHAQVGFLLLFDLHFEEAVNHFLLAEAMQPSEIFPFIIRDPNRWSQLVPRNRYWGLHPPPVPLEQVVDDGLMAVQRASFLRKAGIETTADEDFLSNPPSRADLLKSAIENIIRYLRISHDTDLAPAVQEGVDTLLMYLYRALNRVNDMENLASSQNSCVVEELENLLDDSGHLRTLAFLYASKGMCSKALAIWRILARNYLTGLWKSPATSTDCDSPDTSSDLLSSDQRAAATEASKLLQESSDQDLILEHLGWIADIDQELAVTVLTSEKRVDQLSAEEVLAAIDNKKVEIHQRYLQWLIEDQDSDDTRFHTLYALSLARSALEAVDTDCKSEMHDIARPNEVNCSSVQGGRIYRSPVRERLQIFLQASDLYDPEEVLDLIEGSDLWLEKAILYRKMGQETMVLQILALKLEDSEAAEQYCAEIGRNDAYMQLLDMYLDPQDGKPPMFKAAVRLLHHHGEALDPLQVLGKLSPDMPLQIASDTILRMLKARVHHHRQGQIVHKLSQAMSLDAQLAILEERARHMQINDESICDCCHSRLGTKLFAMYPDDSVVCYKCYRRQGESTSALGRSFMQDPILKPGWLVTR